MVAGVVANCVVVRAYSGAPLGRRAAKVLRRPVQGQPRQRRPMKRNALEAVAQGQAARVRGEGPWLRGGGWRQSGQVALAEIIAATRMKRGAAMIRDGNVLWSSGGSNCAPRSSNVLMGVRPATSGLNAIDLFAHPKILIALEQGAPQDKRSEGDLSPRHHIKWPRTI